MCHVEEGTGLAWPVHVTYCILRIYVTFPCDMLYFSHFYYVICSTGWISGLTNFALVKKEIGPFFIPEMSTQEWTSQNTFAIMDNHHQGGRKIGTKHLSYVYGQKPWGMLALCNLCMKTGTESNAYWEIHVHLILIMVCLSIKDAFNSENGAPECWFVTTSGVNPGQRCWKGKSDSWSHVLG